MGRRAIGFFRPRRQFAGEARAAIHARRLCPDVADTKLAEAKHFSSFSEHALHPEKRLPLVRILV
jgi:hypothetical protein